MKRPAAKEEEFLTDASGKRIGVVLDLQTYQHLREAGEELADLQAYDALRDRAHSEINADHRATLASYRADRKRKAN